MRYFIIAVLTTLLAVAAAVPQNARERFKEEKCRAQACIDAVDDGCPLRNINFSLGCDENGPGA